MVDKKLIENYFNAKTALEEAEMQLFPKIMEICEICGNDTNCCITDIDIHEDGFMMDEAHVSVGVEGECGSDRYFFPKRYLDMEPDDIRVDMEKFLAECDRRETKEEIRRLKAKLRELQSKVGNFG
jgi:hypothetical protein